MMLGRALLASDGGPASVSTEPRLDIHNLSSAVHDDVSLAVHRGEIVGLWVCPAQDDRNSSVLCSAWSPWPPDPIDADGVAVDRLDPQNLIRHGIGYSRDDRKREGLVLSMSVADNLVLASLDRVSRGGVVRRRAVRDAAAGQIERLSIKVPSAAVPVRQLSGGNQQKVVVGKWLAADVKILLLDEPTRGIDVEAKAAMYALLRELAAAGVAILIAPTEIEEALFVCDRIVVLRRGRIVGDVKSSDADPAHLMTLAMGGS